MLVYVSLYYTHFSVRETVLLIEFQYIYVLQLIEISKGKLVHKQHAILPDTPGDVTNASKYFQMFPDPPGAKECALRLDMTILRCSWNHQQLWICIQDVTRYDI